MSVVYWRWAGKMSWLTAVRRVELSTCMPQSGVIDFYNGISGEADADYIRCETNKRFNVYMACFSSQTVNMLVPG